MKPLAALEFVLVWFAAPVMQAAVASLMWRRKLHREFPFFFAYTVTAILSLSRIGLYYWSSQVYFYSYLISEVILIALSFLVIYEVLVTRIFQYYRGIRWLRYAFIAFMVGALVVGVSEVLYLHMAGPILAEMGLRVSQVLFLGFLLFFVVFIGHPVQRYEFGIALGYGVYSSIELLWAALRTQFGQHQRLEIFPALAYDVAALIWLLYFASAQRDQAILPTPVERKELDEANRWKLALRDFIRR